MIRNFNKFLDAELFCRGLYIIYVSRRFSSKIISRGYESYK